MQKLLLWVPSPYLGVERKHGWCSQGELEKLWWYAYCDQLEHRAVCSHGYYCSVNTAVGSFPSGLQSAVAGGNSLQIHFSFQQFQGGCSSCSLMHCLGKTFLCFQASYDRQLP